MTPRRGERPARHFGRPKPHSAHDQAGTLTSPPKASFSLVITGVQVLDGDCRVGIALEETGKSSVGFS